MADGTEPENLRGPTVTRGAVTDPGRAVFLSYASQDAEAAQQLCNALRAAGVEVWFDRSELRGGDAWDALIRRQIKGCYLFVPIISTNTHHSRRGTFGASGSSPWPVADWPRAEPFYCRSSSMIHRTRRPECRISFVKCSGRAWPPARAWRPSSGTCAG